MTCDLTRKPFVAVGSTVTRKSGASLHSEVIWQADIVNSKRLASVLTMARDAQLASIERRSKSCPSRGVTVLRLLRHRAQGVA